MNTDYTEQFLREDLCEMLRERSDRGLIAHYRPIV